MPGSDRAFACTTRALDPGLYINVSDLLPAAAWEDERAAIVAELDEALLGTRDLLRRIHLHYR